MKKILIAIALAVLILPPAVAEAKYRSGGFSSSRSYSSTRSSTSTRSGTTTKTSPTRPANYGTSTKRPGSSVKVGGKTIKSSTKKPSNGKYRDSRGIVGDNGYSPRFSNGYSAPAGSVVYYPQHSFIDYLPWIYLFAATSPQNDKAAVVQPDGKEVIAEPVKEGVDGLAVVNWMVLIALVLGGIAGIVWLVNRFTSGGSRSAYA